MECLKTVHIYHLRVSVVGSPGTPPWSSVQGVGGYSLASSWAAFSSGGLIGEGALGLLAERLSLWLWNS